jgi:hypothetical protein
MNNNEMTQQIDKQNTPHTYNFLLPNSYTTPVLLLQRPTQSTHITTHHHTSQHTAQHTVQHTVQHTKQSFFNVSQMETKTKQTSIEQHNLIVPFRF